MSNIELKNLSIYCTSCVGVVSHLFLFICLAKDPLKCFRNSASYLVGNLALADFIVCTLSLMGDMIFVDKFQTVSISASTTASLISLFSMFSIAIDRYVLTVRPIIYRVLLNGRRIAIWIVSIWILSLYYSIKVSFFGLHYVDVIIYYTIFCMVSLLTGLIYIVTYLSLRKQGRDISEHEQYRNRTLQQKFLKTIIIVAFIQIFTLVPTSVGGLIFHFLNVGKFTAVRLIFRQMYVLNFAINPFLYICRLKNYRRTFCLIVCRKTR